MSKGGSGGFLGTKDIGGVSSGSDGGKGFSQKGAHNPQPVVRNGMNRPPSRSGPPKKGST